LTPVDAEAPQVIQQPLPDLPAFEGDIAFSEAAFSGPSVAMMQEAHEHAANWGAYADPGWEEARITWEASLTRPSPRALIEWARDQSGRLAPNLREQARRAEDARRAYESARQAVSRSICQAAFVQQTRLLASARNPTADDEGPFQ
jgi:hypothetical protein